MEFYSTHKASHYCKLYSLVININYFIDRLISLPREFLQLWFLSLLFETDFLFLKLYMSRIKKNINELSRNKISTFNSKLYLDMECCYFCWFLISFLSQLVSRNKKIQTMNEASLYKEPEKEMATHSSIPAWRIHGRRNLEGYSPWGHKDSAMTEHSRATKSNICTV